VNFSLKRVPGQGILEYVLIISLIPVVLWLVLNLTGVSLRDAYCSVIDTFGIDACQASYFSDSFDNLDQWDIIDGNWQINDGKLCDKGGGRIFAEIPGVEDYQITLSGANLSEGNGFGIMFRSTNFEDDNSYIFQYDPGYGSGRMLFRERANGREFSPSATYNPGGDYNWHDESHDIKLVVKKTPLRLLSIPSKSSKPRMKPGPREELD